MATLAVSSAPADRAFARLCDVLDNISWPDFTAPNIESDASGEIVARLTPAQAILLARLLDS